MSWKLFLSLLLSFCWPDISLWPQWTIVKILIVIKCCGSYELNIIIPVCWTSDLSTYLYLYCHWLLSSATATAAKSLQSCPNLCEPIDSSPSGSPSLGFSRQERWSGLPFLLQCIKVKVKSHSCVQLFTTPWTAAYQAPPFMRLSRQEYWSGLPLPSPLIPLISPYSQFFPLLIHLLHM